MTREEFEQIVMDLLEDKGTLILEREELSAEYSTNPREKVRKETKAEEAELEALEARIIEYLKAEREREDGTHASGKKRRMKAILRFDLPEDAFEYKVASKGSQYYGALWDYAQKLRSLIKHSDEPDTVTETYEKLRTIFYECLSEHDVEL